MGVAIEEAGSLISFVETYLQNVSDGRIGTTDYDMFKAGVVNGGDNYSRGVDLFKIKAPIRETGGINVEVNYMQYDFHEVMSSEVGYAYR